MILTDIACGCSIFMLKNCAILILKKLKPHRSFNFNSIRLNSIKRVGIKNLKVPSGYLNLYSFNYFRLRMPKQILSNWYDLQGDFQHWFLSDILLQVTNFYLDIELQDQRLKPVHAYQFYPHLPHLIQFA